MTREGVEEVKEGWIYFGMENLGFTQKKGQVSTPATLSRHLNLKNLDIALWARLISRGGGRNTHPENIYPCEDSTMQPLPSLAQSCPKLHPSHPSIHVLPSMGVPPWDI